LRSDKITKTISASYFWLVALSWPWLLAAQRAKSDLERRGSVFVFRDRYSLFRLPNYNPSFSFLTFCRAAFVVVVVGGRNFPTPALPQKCNNPSLTTQMRYLAVNQRDLPVFCGSSTNPLACEQAHVFFSFASLLTDVSYKTYQLFFGYFPPLVLGDWVTVFEVLWSGPCARLVSQASHQHILFLGFSITSPAGFFCRVQGAGCRLKFNYNWKTAGT